jgi:hypothetical protein
MLARTSSLRDLSKLVDELFGNLLVKVSPGVHIARKGGPHFSPTNPTSILQYVLQSIHSSTTSGDRDKDSSR